MDAVRPLRASRVRNPSVADSVYAWVTVWPPENVQVMIQFAPSTLMLANELVWLGYVRVTDPAHDEVVAVGLHDAALVHRGPRSSS
jgi:hypothetical protein